MKDDKPHLVLDWIFNVPNQTLICTIDDELSYSAIEGGEVGINKHYKGETIFIAPGPDWDTGAPWNEEKLWISENYGEQVGYFQLDHNRVVTHPFTGEQDRCPMGIGPDGRYLDHLQRRQAILESQDCSEIYRTEDQTVWETPDCGKTIYKRIPTTDTHYSEFAKTNNETHKFERIAYPEHPQPCLQQPRSPGRTFSSYDDMLENGISEDIVNKCKAMKWEKPLHPELQYMIEMGVK
jgi:hypothetical protein